MRVLKQAGFSEISDKAGSYRTFVSATGLKIFCHRPHPGNIVKKYLLREIVRTLDEMEGKENE
ncbi:type II toxin-antitoxin system HicA family toxin [Massilia sp. TWR1-2-2]|uniref:type II toxin-antitoxin system HicA family toxin n=1 Tax=Massilia sp. TWR1-2-2 TaxID=2804584 RepID=UPI003CF8E4FE